MNLKGEIRESISLDEDDLSDVEDEVFIRDGKNGYKLAEEINVKRPLMAPRRKGKPSASIRIKSARPTCRALCKPCCYVFAALSVLIGLIIVVVILVSLFPLPLDKLKNWILSRSKTSANSGAKLAPCHYLKVQDIWTMNLPKLTTDSPVRLLDVNNDGIEDVLFGFGTGDNYNILPPDKFCPIFMGVPPPCKGGALALNGLTGEILWRFWLNDTIFSLQCTADVNNDNLNDCLAIGIQGTIVMIDSKKGTDIWKITSRSDVYVANFIPDQNNDNISDILTSHSSLDKGSKDNHIVLISGKNGMEISRTSTPNNAKSFYMPQILNFNESASLVIIGTGGPNSPGNLSAIALRDLFSNNSKPFQLLYQDQYNGMLTQSILVDLTGDEIPDIVTAMYNSTLVAINGATFKQIWNFTIPGSRSETDIEPTPAYFNYDNVTDFLITYQKYDGIVNKNYSQSFIIDGKTGKSITDPFTGSVKSQMNGLAIGMESFGYDMYLFWTKSDDGILKLNALHQFHQPPGLEIYNSNDRRSIEFKRTKSPLRQIKEYFVQHPIKLSEDRGQNEMNINYNVDPIMPIGIHKYGNSIFRHKDKNTGIVKDYNSVDAAAAADLDTKYDNDFDWNQNQNNNNYFNNYGSIDDDAIPYNQKEELEEVLQKNNRDPRSKTTTTHNKNNNNINEEEDNQSVDSIVKTRKKNLSDPKYGIYGYKNIQMAKSRLLHDVNDLPTEILKDTYFKNEERRLKKSKFEQRDINSHKDKAKDNAEVKKIIEAERNAVQNGSLNLWQLESEKEMQDRDDALWRSKRTISGRDLVNKTGSQVTSVGAITDAFNRTNGSNTIDLIFITYWVPNGKQQQQILDEEIDECIEDKLTKYSSEDYQKTTENEQRALFKEECQQEQDHLKENFLFFNKVHLLNLGQMTVYRVRLSCECEHATKGERCAKFLNAKEQNWPTYLGRLGNGVFQQRRH